MKLFRGSYVGWAYGFSSQIYIYGDENNQNFWIKPVLSECIHDSQ